MANALVEVITNLKAPKLGPQNWDVVEKARRQDLSLSCLDLGVSEIPEKLFAAFLRVAGNAFVLQESGEGQEWEVVIKRVMNDIIWFTFVLSRCQSDPIYMQPLRRPFIALGSGLTNMYLTLERLFHGKEKQQTSTGAICRVFMRILGDLCYNRGCPINHGLLRGIALFTNKMEAYCEKLCKILFREGGLQVMMVRDLKYVEDLLEKTYQEHENEKHHIQEEASRLKQESIQQGNLAASRLEEAKETIRSLNLSLKEYKKWGKPRKRSRSPVAPPRQRRRTKGRRKNHPKSRRGKSNKETVFLSNPETLLSPENRTSSPTEAFVFKKRIVFGKLGFGLHQLEIAHFDQLKNSRSFWHGEKISPKLDKSHFREKGRR